MIAAHRLKGLGWFASCVAIVLGFYLVSLQVAAERKKLEGMNRQIAAAQRDIRALETEFDTRANLAQLERWNGDTLALAAPTAGQFVTSEAQLAALDVNAPSSPGLQVAALVVPSAPGLPPVQMAQALQPATPQPAPVQPAPVQPSVQMVRQPVAAPTAQPQLVRVAAVKPRSVPVEAAQPRLVKAVAVRVVEPERPSPALARAVNATRASAAVAKVRPQAVAMLDRKLLSDSTFSDIMSGARAEMGKRR